MENNKNIELRAHVDFICVDETCKEVVKFNVMELEQSKGVVQCENCRREYQFDKEFIDKLRRLRDLVFAVQNAADILGDINVAVQTPSHEVKVPYSLLLTRLNTMISMDVGNGNNIDFNFRIEPLNNGRIR